MKSNIHSVLELTIDAWAAVLAYCEDARRRQVETQFYLLGPPTKDRNKRVVTRVLRAGTPIEEPARTIPDYSASAQALAPLLAQGLVVQGEGHLHSGLVGPSGGDIDTLQSLDADLFPEYLCFVVTMFQNGEAPVARAVAIRNGEPVEFTVHITEEHTTRQEYAPFLPASVKNEDLVVFGCGSGGGTVALQASKWGVRTLTLVDHDTFEPRNLQRHLADEHAVGQAKASWLQAFLQARLPKTKVRAVQLKITPSTRAAVSKLVRDHSYVGNCTGHPVASLLLGEECRREGKPVVHAGVFSRGSGGFVFRQDAAATSACYSCLFKLTKHAQPDDEESVEQLKKQYGFTDEELEGQLGLWTDANLTSSLQAKVLLDLIKNDTPATANLFVWDNQTLKLTAATVTQDAECPTCHPSAAPKLVCL